MLLGLTFACAAFAPPPGGSGVLDTAGGTLGTAAVPITGAPADHDALVTAIGEARFVLLGESTHGTQEFYRERARLTQRLVRERGFNAVVVEGDWSATARVNRYVRGLGSDRNADQALAGYSGFPRWMWRNREFRAFVEQLRAYNLPLPPARRVGVYGMDVYDVTDASRSVLRYLRERDPTAAARAARRYRCFARYGGEMQAYGVAVRRPERSCEKPAAEVLADLRRLPRPGEPAEAEAYFAAVRSAASVAAGEEYFRAAYAGSLAWNARDRRMADTVEAVAEHVSALSRTPGKVVVWAHNTHSGDARATVAANRGEFNVGQLMRQRHGAGAFLIGLMSYAGTVTAAPEWDAGGSSWPLKPALPGSYADVLHREGRPAFALLIRGNEPLVKRLGEPRLERAIGVVYRPDAERTTQYFPARLSEQFDALLFFDRSTAVRPILAEPDSRPPAGATTAVLF